MSLAIAIHPPKSVLVTLGAIAFGLILRALGNLDGDFFNGSRPLS